MQSRLFALNPAGGWIATLGSASDDRGYGVAVDSGGNVIVTGVTVNATNNNSLTALYSQAGTLQWQKSYYNTYGATPRSEVNWCVVTVGTTSTIAGELKLDGSAGQKPAAVKYTSAGAASWQIWQTTQSTSSRTYGISYDSNGNFYMAGDFDTTNSVAFVTKHNSSQVIQWYKYAYTAGVSLLFRGVSSNSAGTQINVVGYTSAGEMLIMQFDSTGAVVWGRKLDYATGNDIGNGIATDSSGNIYVVGENTTNAQTIIAKYNSSGTIQWQRKISNSGGKGIAVDTSGNVYIVGYGTITNQQIFIAKYNSSGTLQWQRYIGGTGADTGYGIATDSAGYCYVAGVLAGVGVGGDDILTAKLPDSGSNTGTFGSITYGISSLTEAAGTGTDSALSYTGATLSYTSYAFDITTENKSLTSSVTQI